MTALKFLTIIDFAPGFRVSSKDLGPSLVFFPLVGVILGAALFALDFLFTGRLGPALMGGLECGLLALLTRGLHLDGLADTADGILSSRPREEALAIMKDSSTGALGALTLVIVVLIKALALGEISSSGERSWLLLAPMLSRASLVVLAALSPYARKGGGLGSYFCGKVAKDALVASAALSLALSSIIGGAEGIVAWGASISLGCAASLWFKKRLGGITGDCLGAHLEITEAAMLVWGCIKL